MNSARYACVSVVMGRRWAWTAVVAVGALLAHALPASAKLAPDRVDEWAAAADVVVVARATSTSQGHARLRKLRVLKGRLSADEFSVSPLGTRSCVRGSGAPFPEGARVLLFLAGSSDMGHRPVHGNTWLLVTGKTGEAAIAAVERTVAIAALDDPGERLAAYIDAVQEDDPALRGIAAPAIGRLAKDRLGAFEGRLVRLFDSPHREARLCALQALRFRASALALPAYLAALEHDDPSTRRVASMAVARYDTEETVAALLRAAAKDPQMAPRVIIDLRLSRRPEARTAIARFLRDEDPKVRATAAGSYRNRLSRDRPFTDELHRVLGDDPDAEVRARAASTLAKSQRPDTVLVLLDALRRPELERQEEIALVRSLRTACAYFRDNRKPVPHLAAAEDAAGLLEHALGAGGWAAQSAVELLQMADTPACRAVLDRVRAGEFGEELVERASK